MSYIDKLNSREAWLKRLNLYWNSKSFPRFITRVGEIFEVDFGENVGTEFSGRHLAVCIEDSRPDQEKMLVVPLTTKYESYNIDPSNIIETSGTYGDTTIKAGVVLGEARWISKHRIFRASAILKEPDTVINPVKGKIEISKTKLKAWRAV